MPRWISFISIVLGLLLPSGAKAANCLPLYELEKKKLLGGTYEILHADEPDLREHAVLIGQIEARLPCADFEVSAPLWSRYLVSIAIREHYQKGDWEEAITTALRMDPEVEMPVGAGHPFRSFDPAPAHPAGDRSPTGWCSRRTGSLSTTTCRSTPCTCSSAPTARTGRPSSSTGPPRFQVPG